jgi:PucR family transcriptional regulator, purine catabolism regulatory protein
VSDYKRPSPRVADLLASPALQLRLVAGAAGLRRSVSWAHVSELEDPTPWLLGAEVIMTTGIAVPRSADAQRAYLERLDDAGVSALAISAQLHMPTLHDAFLDAAERRGFPVLEVPLSVPFIAIAQEVATALQEDQGQRLGAQLQVFGALRWMAAENLDAGSVFHRLEQLSGYRIHLCTPQGRPLLPGVRVPPDLSVLPASVDAPPTIPGGFAVPVHAPEGTVGFLVAFEREGAYPAGLAVVQHIATVAALHIAMVRHQRETLRREGAETLAELLQDVLDPAVARRRLQRLAIQGDNVLLILRDVADDALLPALDEQPYLLLQRGDEHYLLGSRLLGEAVARLPGVVVGVSRPFQPGESLRIAQREARSALAKARQTGRALVAYGDDPTERWLTEDPAVLAALVEQVLGPVLAYDAQHDSLLLASVRTWMERDRRSESAAEALHIHPNTLAYRLRRFAALTGHDPSSSDAFAEIWLALRAAEQLGMLG